MEAFLPIMAGVVAVGAVFVMLSAVISEARDSGWFRALTYPSALFLIIWAIYDHVREYGARNTFVGFSEQEFQERFGRGKQPASAAVAD